MTWGPMGSPAFAETLEKLYPWVGAGVPILNLHTQASEAMGREPEQN